MWMITLSPNPSSQTTPQSKKIWNVKVNNVRKWIIENHFKMNDSKVEFYGFCASEII